MEYLLPAFLNPYLNSRPKVCSVGCGMAFDVEALNRLGYDAHGFDPGSRSIVWSDFPSELQSKLSVGYAHEYPAGRGVFDAVYSLEVLEHVGCHDGGTKLQADWEEQRRVFIKACLDMTRPGGVVLLASLNRWFPADLKHKHGYSKLQRVTGFLVNPLNKRNFLPTIADIKRYIDQIGEAHLWEVVRLPTATYPSGAGRAGREWLTATMRIALRIMDLPVLNAFNPILLVEIRPRVCE